MKSTLSKLFTSIHLVTWPLVVHVIRNSRQVCSQNRIHKRNKRTDTQFLCFLTRSESFFDDMLQLWRNVRIKSVKQILQLFSGVDVCDIGQHFHFLFELIFQKSVVNSYNSLDVDSSNIELWQIIHMKPGFYQIDATHIPFVWSFTFLQSDISTCLEFCFKSTNTGFVGISEFFVHSIKNLFNVVNLLLF